MDIEVKIDENCSTPKVIVYTNKVDKDVSDIINALSNITSQSLKVFKDEKMYILNQDDIETIYSENGKVFVRCSGELYTIKNRLYTLELLLNPKSFLRISHSEIVNFDKLENIDFKIVGSLILNFKSGYKTYASRRYIPKIKEFLEI